MSLQVKEVLEQAKLLINNPKYIGYPNRILNLEAELADPQVWLHSEKIQAINKQLKKLNDRLLSLKDLADQVEEYSIAQDIGAYPQGEKILARIDKINTEIKVKEYFTGKLDNENALVSIHAGAGGTDAQDWASMIMSMYQAFAKNNNMTCSIISISSGNETGVKSATIEIKGEHAYGLLKEEAGVHRLVRISPFNSGGTRETSFCLVEVIPDNVSAIVSDTKINEDDIEWEYHLSSGKGGQSVNTTYSAVRLKHKPSGIVVNCQNERSQHQNKQMALKYLQNKLNIEDAKKQSLIKEELRGELHSPEWGSQIRNYVLHPYKLVKDLRSEWESSAVEDIITYGNILPIIFSVKEKKLTEINNQITEFEDKLKP